MKKLLIVLIIGLGIVGLWRIVDRLFYQLACEGQLLWMQTPATSQEVRANQAIGQSFVAPRDNLNRVEVWLQTFNRRNTQDVLIFVLDITDTPRQVYSTTFNASTVQNNTWYALDFAPIPDSQGRTYLIKAESPTSQPGDAIALTGVPKDIYPHGVALLENTPLSADVAFRACFALSPLEKWQTFIAQVTQNRPGWWGHEAFYTVLLVGYGLGMLALFGYLVRL